MPTISLCMIVKNEEEVLEQCLNSVIKACDEIVIVDTGSTDLTKEIARKFTNNIFDYEWIDDFAAARNFAFSKATKDYIFWLDADDILRKEDAKKLLELKSNLPQNIDVVSMYYILDFDPHGNPSFIFRRNRLVKRTNHFRWVGPVHEYLEVGGNIFPADIAVIHKKGEKNIQPQAVGRNLRIYENRLKKGEEFTPRDLYYYANELMDHGLNKKAIIYYQKFLDTKQGWVEDNICACKNMANVYKALENDEKRMEALLKSLSYDIPRPEICCNLGDIFKENKDYQTAVFWYNTAYQFNKETNGFQNIAYSTWYPHLQLCTCHWELGNVTKSIEHNNSAKKYRPDDPSVKFNEEFFKTFLNKDKNNNSS